MELAKLEAPGALSLALVNATIDAMLVRGTGHEPQLGAWRIWQSGRSKP